MAQEENVGAFSLESIEFIFRHPWIIICSIVIMVNMAHAYISSKPLKYQCRAVLSFELVGDSFGERRSADPKKDLIDARRDLISKVLLGDSIQSIVEDVWPGINAKKDPMAYNNCVERLRNPGYGIQIQQDDKTNINLVNISYISTNPQFCYKVVNAAAHAIINENKKISEGRIQAKIIFFNKQLDFYKNKVEKIDKEMNGLKSELLDNFSLLTEQEKDIIVGITGDSEGAKQQRLTTFAKYDETLAQLNMDLLEAQKKRENLQRQLSGDAGAYRRRTDDSAKEDIFLSEYSKAVAAKELEIANLVAGGYKIAHPQIKKLQSEIESLKELGKLRNTELAEETGGFGKKSAKERITLDMEELDFQIDSLKSKIELIKGYRRGTVEQFKPRQEFGRKDISDKVSRLADLGKEKSINEGYYLDIRKQLEEADLKGRIQKEEVGLRIIMVEEPGVPIGPIRLQRIKPLLMGFLLSLVIGGGLAYLVDSIGNSVRTSEQLRALLMIPILATIDKITTVEQLAAKRMQIRGVMLGLIGVVIASRILIKLFLRK